MPATYDYWCPECHMVQKRYRNARRCRGCGFGEIERLPPTRTSAIDALRSAIEKTSKRWPSQYVAISLDDARALLMLVDPTEPATLEERQRLALPVSDVEWVRRVYDANGQSVYLEESPL
jgi:hypothetical protein